MNEIRSGEETGGEGGERNRKTPYYHWRGVFASPALPNFPPQEGPQIAPKQWTGDGILWSGDEGGSTLASRAVRHIRVKQTGRTHFKNVPWRG
jgi:hypothetical protein